MFTLKEDLYPLKCSMTSSHLRRHWGRLFRVRSVTHEANGCLTALLLER